LKPIVWTDDFSVGIVRFDEQHKKLIQMINRLIEEPQVATGSETISELLNDMTNYAQEHFAAEEELMRQHSYPDLDKHAAQHIAFRRQTVDFCMATMGDVRTVPESMFQYLRDWLIGHILGSDMTYKPFFNDLGIR
jgi:hemerythrin